MASKRSKATNLFEHFTLMIRGIKDDLNKLAQEDGAPQHIDHHQALILLGFECVRILNLMPMDAKCEADLSNDEVERMKRVYDGIKSIERSSSEAYRNYIKVNMGTSLQNNYGPLDSLEIIMDDNFKALFSKRTQSNDNMGSEVKTKAALSEPSDCYAVVENHLKRNLNALCGLLEPISHQMKRFEILSQAQPDQQNYYVQVKDYGARLKVLIEYYHRKLAEWRIRNIVKDFDSLTIRHFHGFILVKFPSSKKEFSLIKDHLMSL